MPAHPRVGTRWSSEHAPPITVEHDRMVDRMRSVRVHGKRYRHVIDVREYALPDKEVEHKLYAPRRRRHRRAAPRGRGRPGRLRRG